MDMCRIGRRRRQLPLKTCTCLHTSPHCAFLLQDGLAAKEAKLLPVLGLLAKSRREETFPAHLLQHGLAVDIQLAEASKQDDKRRILNSVACPRARTRALEDEPQADHANYSEVNRSLASHFAINGLYAHYAQGRDASPLLAALRADTARMTMQLSLTGCKHFQGSEQRALMANLPRALQSLRLDLGQTWLQSFELDECPCQLRSLLLRFSGKYLRKATGVTTLLASTLLELELWFSSLPELEDLDFNNALLLAFEMPTSLKNP